MTVNNLNARKQQWSDKVGILAENNPTLLQSMFETETATSASTFYLDHYGDVGEASDNVAIPNSDAFTNPATYADYVATLTGHAGLTYQRTQISPKVTDWSYTFNPQDTWETALNNEIIITKGVAKIKKVVEKTIVDALVASSVTRQDATDATVSVDLPADCQTSDAIKTAVDALDVLADGAVFTTKTGDDEQVYCLIHPKTKVQLIANDKTTFASTDFVSSTKAIEEGKLPTIGGIVFIEHTMVAEDKMVYFQKSALRRVEWKAFEATVDKDIGRKNRLMAYMEVVQNSVRVDDDRVFVRTLPAI